MLIPRRTQLANANGVRTFHVWSTLAPGGAMLATGDMKVWVAKLLRRLAGAYAVEVLGFSIAADQFHLVLEWQPEAADAWSEEEFRRRWLTAHPPYKGKAQPAQREPGAGEQGPGLGAEMGAGAGMGADATFLPGASRARLASLSAFLQQFKQMVAYKIKRETKQKGSVWRNRFKLYPLAGRSEIAGLQSFVDLQPVAHGDGGQPEESPVSSVHAAVYAYWDDTRWVRQMMGVPDQFFSPWDRLPADIAAGFRATPLTQEDEDGRPPGGPDFPGGGLGGGPGDGPGNAFKQLGLPMISLGNYLHLLDALASFAKSWPHLPARAPGRAKAPETPALAEAVGDTLGMLGLDAGAFAAQWKRMARVRL